MRNAELIAGEARSPAGFLSVEPLDAADLAARGPDSGNGGAGVFHGGRHVMRIGVDDAVGVARDRHVAFPENQIATPQVLSLRRGKASP
jgi:hypothetical protein